MERTTDAIRPQRRRSRLERLMNSALSFRMLDVLGTGLEALLAILAGLDQAVEYRNRFFIQVSHFQGSLRVTRVGTPWPTFLTLTIALPMPDFKIILFFYFN